MTTGTDIALPTGVLMDPWTGEALELANLSGDELRAYVERSTEVKAAIRDADHKVAEELMRRKNSGDPVKGIEVTRRNTWRSGETGAALDKLESDGKLPTAREHYLREEVTYKAIGRNLQSLADQLVADGDTEAAGVLLTARRQSLAVKVKS